MAERLLGSAGTFDREGRRSSSSLNYVACHDGFTLADVTAYREKHNAANGEDNHDGQQENFSDNFDAEGETAQTAIPMRPAQRRRHPLPTVFFSKGTPILHAGHDTGHKSRKAWWQGTVEQDG